MKKQLTKKKVYSVSEGINILVQCISEIKIIIMVDF